MDSVKIGEQNNPSLGNLPSRTALRIGHVEHLHIHTGDGAMNSSNKSVNFHGSVSGNTNVNTGDNVQQQINLNEGSAIEAFAQLFKDIQEKTNDSQRAQFEFFAEKLKEAYDKGDKKEGQKLLGFLKDALGNIASIATIAGLFGVTL